MRATLGFHQFDGVVRPPALHEYGGGAEQKRAFERIDGAADVSNGRRDQEFVAPLDEPVIADLADQCMDRVMTMQDTLRAASRTRCVENHPDCVGVDSRKLLPAV